MQADSQEAGYLSAFCPISKVPTLVVIQYVFILKQKSHAVHVGCGLVFIESVQLKRNVF